MDNYKAEITISLRKGILDVQGKTVEQALHTIDFPDISNVRIGKYVELNVIADTPEKAQSLVEDACKKLVANPIIEDFHVNIVK
jgi:phosphoribosylformylglycinamidine synthase subunit PurS